MDYCTTQNMSFSTPAGLEHEHHLFGASCSSHWGQNEVCAFLALLQRMLASVNCDLFHISVLCALILFVL